VPGFTFVGREAEVAAFREMLGRPQGELLLVAGPEGSGKSHFLRQLRQEAEGLGRHVVLHCRLGYLLDADLRQYAIISALAAAHDAGPPRPVGPGEAERPALHLVPNPREFFGHLLGEDRRPVTQKLLGVLAAASRGLDADSRLVVLLDMGRVESADAFPIEFVAHRLPEGVKMVIGIDDVPSGLEEMANATVIPHLPPFDEGEARRLLEFHLPEGAPAGELAGPLLARFAGNPLTTDAAVKLLAGAPDPAAALANLPATAAGLCKQLLGRLNDTQRALVECIARVPSGLDTDGLRKLLGPAGGDAGPALLEDEVRDIVLTHRTARGTEVHVFHESFGDLFLGEKSPGVTAFHKRAATHFLDLVQKNPHDVDALGAHSYHIRLSGDRVGFLQDFPRTLRLKQNLGLLHLLAGEYRLLLLWARSGDAPVNRPLCMSNLARIYQQLGQPQEALRYHKDALDIYQRDSDRHGTAAQLSAIASVLSDLGHQEEAVKSLQQAMAINESLGNKAALAADLATLGTLLERLDRTQDALRAHQRSLEIYRELRNELDAAAQLSHIAALLRKLGNPSDAVARYQEAWRLNNRNGATRAEIADLCHLGMVFDELGDMEKAITCLQQAIELDRMTSEHHGESAHLRTLADMHLKVHDTAAAVQCLERSATLAHSYGDPLGEIQSLLALAAAYREGRRLDDARRTLEQAAALAARFSNPKAQAQALEALEELNRLAAEQPSAEARPADEELRDEEALAEAELADDVQLEGTADSEARTERQPEPHDAPGPAGGAAALAAQRLGELETTRAELEEMRQRVADLEAKLEEVIRANQSLKKALDKARPKN